MKYLLVILMFGIMGYTNTKVKIDEEENKRVDIIAIAENTNFIKKDKDTNKYKILKDRLIKENLRPTTDKSFPRSNRISDDIEFTLEEGYKNIDNLDKFNIDEQIYIVGNYYLSSDNKNVDKYINILETNINEKQKELQKKDNLLIDENVKENEKWLDVSKALIKISLIGIPIDGIFVALEHYVDREERKNHENR